MEVCDSKHKPAMCLGLAFLTHKGPIECAFSIIRPPRKMGAWSVIQNEFLKVPVDLLKVLMKLGFAEQYFLTPRIFFLG